MSFFDAIPEPPPPEPVQTEQPAWMRSDAVIPGSVPGETLLVRTGEVAVAIGSVRGYPNGSMMLPGFFLSVSIEDIRHGK